MTSETTHTHTHASKKLSFKRECVHGLTCLNKIEVYKITSKISLHCYPVSSFLSREKDGWQLPVYPHGNFPFISTYTPFYTTLHSWSIWHYTSRKFCILKIHVWDLPGGLVVDSTLPMQVAWVGPWLGNILHAIWCSQKKEKNVCVNTHNLLLGHDGPRTPTPCHGLAANKS